MWVELLTLVCCLPQPFTAENLRLDRRAFTSGWSIFAKTPSEMLGDRQHVAGSAITLAITRFAATTMVRKPYAGTPYSVFGLDQTMSKHVVGPCRVIYLPPFIFCRRATLSPIL